MSLIVEADELQVFDAMESRNLVEHRQGDVKYWTVTKDPSGNCPKLIDGRCSIWSNRPRMCKRFDCRLHALAELDPHAIPASLSERIASWKFSFDREDDVIQQQSFLRAMKFLNANSEIFAARGIESGSIKMASLAVDLRHLFDDSTKTTDEAQLLAEVLLAIRTMQQRLRNPSTG